MPLHTLCNGEIVLLMTSADVTVIFHDQDMLTKYFNTLSLEGQNVVTCIDRSEFQKGILGLENKRRREISRASNPLHKTT